jgi:hypothetical protein
MAKKLTYSEIDAVIAKFSDVTSTNPKLTLDGVRSYAYAAGALQAQLVCALLELPAHRQKITLEILQQLTDKYSVKA